MAKQIIAKKQLLRDIPLPELQNLGKVEMPANEVIQKKDIKYDSLGFFTPQMIKVFADLRLPWMFDPDVSLKYDSEAYDKMRRYPVIVSKTEEALSKLAGVNWYFFSESDTGNATVPYLTALLRRCEDFNQCRSWLARSYVEGRSWLQVRWKLVHLSIGKDITRPWWIPYKLIPVHKSQFLLRHSNYFDEKLGIDNIKYWWDRMNPVNMRPFIIDQDEYLTSVKDAAHLNWSYGWGKYDCCFPVHQMAVNTWQKLCDAIESVLFPGVAFAYDPKSILAGDYSGTGDTPETPAGDKYLSMQRDAIKNMRNFGFFAFPGAEHVTMLDRDGGGMAKVLELLRYFEQKMTEIIGISINPGGGMESPGAPGSMASSRVGSQIRDETLQSLCNALVEEPIQSQIVTKLWKYNYRNFQALGLDWSDSAVFKVGTEQAVDQQKKSEGFALALQYKVEISKKDFRKHYDLETPTDADDVLVAQEQQPGMQPGMPGMQPEIPQQLPDIQKNVQAQPPGLNQQGERIRHLPDLAGLRGILNFSENAPLKKKT